MPAKARTDRSSATRDRLLDAAERLFAERGLHAVSNRQVAEAAGQGNTAVVGYHVGTWTDLVLAVATLAWVERLTRNRERVLSR